MNSSDQSKKKNEEYSNSEQKKYSLIQTSTSFIIESRPSKNQKISTKLLINRKTQAIKQCSNIQNDNDSTINEYQQVLLNGIQTDLDYKEDIIENVQSFDALLGIIQIQEYPFLLVVKDKNLIANIQQQHDIYEIQSVDFIPFQNMQYTKKVKEYMEGVQQILKNNHYFSYTYPLSLSRNRISLDSNNEDIFCWNNKLANQFTVYNIDSDWVVKIIQGYVGQFRHTFNQVVQVTLICRRSYKRGGTRYIHRGVDSDGYVANYCENEQIIESNDYIFSNILIRGSVPVFWEQVGMQAHLRLTRGENLNEQAYQKHFQMLEKQYFEGLQRGRVHSFNLMQQNDKYEQMLNDVYLNNFKKYSIKQNKEGLNENTLYEFYDFHKRASDLDEYVRNVMHNTQDYLYFKEQKNQQGFKQHQIGFFRINCKDCLDRTNSFMMRIAFWQLESILKEELNIQFISEQEKESSVKIFDIQHPFIQQLKQLWIENGNSISNLYAGTDSTTKNASSGLQYKLNAYVIGMKRFYNCNYNDSLKMECINLITCQHFNSKSDLELPDDVSEVLEKRRNIFQSKEKLKIQVVSWNVMALVPQPGIQFQNLLDRQNQDKPDIIVIGLQEIIKVSKFKIQNLFGNKHDEKVTKLWTQIIQRHIQEQVDKSYMLIHSCDMMGNFLMVFANPAIKEMIKNIETETVKCGLVKKAADVGAVICRLQINETSICLVHCNLPGGRSKKKIQQRYEALNHIHNTAFQKESNGKSKTNKIDQSDLIILFGDLNFRVDLDHDTAQEIIQTYDYFIRENQQMEAINQLLEMQKHDQLVSSDNIKNQSSIQYYIEGTIQFPPNYIDRTKKKRTPSWRGRILFWLNDELSTINQRFYTLNKQNQESDHKPVTSYFEINTMKIDFEKRNLVLQDIFREKDIISDTSSINISQIQP